jgi:hypothetical protein
VFFVCHFLSLVNMVYHVLIKQLFLNANYVKIGYIVIQKHFFKKSLQTYNVGAPLAELH